MTDRMVLLGYVKFHSAAENRTRPGQREMVRFTGAANTTIIRVTDALVKAGHLRVLRTYPKGDRKATEFAIPWLRNPLHQVANATGPQVANERANATTTDRYQGDAHSRAASPVAGCLNCDATGWVFNEETREAERCLTCNPGQWRPLRERR